MRTRMALGAAVLGLAAAACTSSGRTVTTTSAPNPNWYPPIIRTTSSATFVRCLGREPTGLTTAGATQIIDQVQALVGDTGVLQSTGSCAGGPVIIGLGPGQERFANRLLARYGKEVALIVGFMPYGGRPVRSPTCGQVAASRPLPAGLRLSLRLRESVVKAGSSFEGTVVVRNGGQGAFEMDTGQPLVAVVVRPGTRQVVGISATPIAGTGYATRLTPGQTGTIPVFGGTARCDGGMGSALPPGTYQVLVQVSPEGRVHTPNYLTPPVPLVVTAS